MIHRMWWLACLITFNAHAQTQTCTTLVYQGAPLTITGTGTIVQLAPLVGVVTLSQPLGIGFADQTNISVAFDFSETYFHLSNQLPDVGDFQSATFSFSTDKTGKIISWSMFLSASNSSLEQTTFTATSNQTRDTVTFMTEADPTVPPTNETGVSSEPGTWSCITDLLTDVIINKDYLIEIRSMAAQLVNTRAEIIALTAEVEKLKK